MPHALTGHCIAYPNTITTSTFNNHLLNIFQYPFTIFCPGLFRREADESSARRARSSERVAASSTSLTRCAQSDLGWEATPRNRWGQCLNSRKHGDGTKPSKPSSEDIWKEGKLDFRLQSMHQQHIQQWILCPLHSSRALQLDNVFCIGTPLPVLQFPLPVWRC